MNKKLYILILFILITTNVYAFRMGKPTKLKFPIDEGQIATLNNNIETIWDITNGRYSINVVSSIPTTTDAKEGEMQVYSSGGTYRLYIFLNGGWRYATLN